MKRCLTLVPARLAAACQAPAPTPPRASAIAAGPITAATFANDDAKVTLRVTYTGTHRFFRVYVDTDRLPSTGFPRQTIGANFLIENGNLRHYAGDGKSWKWDLDGPVSFQDDGGQITWTISRAALGETDLCHETADLVFDIDDTAAAPVTVTYAPAASCNDAGPTPPAPLADLSVGTPALTSDAQTLHCSLGFTGAPAFWRIYVDGDQDPGTGFAAAPGVGAEYLIENGALYGYQGPLWRWSFLADVAAFDHTSAAAAWTIARASVGATAPCGAQATLMFQLQDGAGAVVSGPPVTTAFADIGPCAGASGGGSRIKYVFVIAMENESAASIYGSASAPYLNGQILPRYARADRFLDPLPDALPSEPHYVWMEAGTNSFADATFLTDGDPSAANSTASTAHLVAQMRGASPPVSWLSFQEGLDPATTGACPVQSAGFYAAKHDPFVFFRDVAGSPPSPTNADCAAHHRAYTTAAFAQALASKTVAQFNFITPDLCHDMHGGAGCPGSDDVLSGDQWLATNLPPIIDFANANDGVIFLVWDEPTGGSALTPFIAIGPHLRAGYAGAVTYDHGSLTRSIERIFGLPALNAVAGVNDFGDLFEAGLFP
jgi:hypothetical protein